MATLTFNADSRLAFNNTASPAALTLVAAVAAGDRVIVKVASETPASGVNANTTRTVTGITSVPALTWTKRTALMVTGTGGNVGVHQGLEIWYADSVSGNGASGLAITVAMSGAVESGDIYAYSVTSSNGTVSWDTNVALPATAQNSTAVNSTPAVSGVSTTGATSAIMYFSAACTTVAMVTPTGYTQIDTHDNSAGAVNFETSSLGFKTFVVAQTGVTITSTGTTTSMWGVIADALTPGAAEVDVPTSTHGLGISMSAALNLNLPSLNAGLGITFSAGQPQNFPVAKIVPAPFLLGLTESFNSLSNLLMPAVTFTLGLSVARWQVTQVVPLAANISLGIGESVVRFGTTLPLPAVTMALGLQEQSANISGATQRQVRTIVDVGT